VSSSARVFTCDRCENQSCKIEVNTSKEGLGDFDPKYCPYSSRYASWSEDEDGVGDGSDGLVPNNVKHKIRNTGKMWVVETVMSYGEGFTSRKDVSYFYSKRRAEKEYDARKSGDGSR